MIERDIQTDVEKALWEDDKIVAIMGARQVGKTTLLEGLLGNRDDVLWLNGDDRSTLETFADFDKHRFAELIDGYSYLVIDEAQRIADIGLNLKIIQDNFKGSIKVAATGSSSFDLANKINEPLTGRKHEFHLLPFSVNELVRHFGLAQERLELERRLTYGMYPEVVLSPGREEQLLLELANANLYKDVLAWGNIQRSDKLISLLQALAYQIGSQVSINEIAQLIGLDPKTVEKYIMLLEQAFVIFHFGSFSRNLRNELKASRKYYFYDVGIRNAIINNFAPPSSRTDIGHVFENFVIAELVKRNTRLMLGHAGFFWRTTAGQEVDYVHEEGGKISAYEIKYNPKAKGRIPMTFVEAYQPAELAIIDKENYYQFLVDS
ncbi:MAG: ATP-binding protein [Eggerthellaceae bacterium]|nr:ATP-binding protein [Eggerthellaceae bacterium]